MVIDVFFTNPDYISSDNENPDVAMLTFYNTELYLKPQNLEKKAIGDGFRLKVNLPVQMNRSALKE